MTQDNNKTNEHGQTGGLALAPCWPSMAPAERNNLVGEQLGMEPLTQCWIGCSGKMLLCTRWTEEQKSEAEAMARMMQHHDRLWESSLKDYSSLTPEMRGKLVVIVDRRHLRYSDTPGGGWEVVEWLRGRGEVKVESVADQWRVVFDDGHPHHGRIIVAAPTMAEAACLVALRVRPANVKGQTAAEADSQKHI